MADTKKDDCAENEDQNQELELTTNTLEKSTGSPGDIEYEYVPPDGGWGWLVLGGSVLVSLLIPGTIKSFGILFVEFLEVFKASPVAASWIPALTYFLYCSLGPLASYLSTKYSYRTVTLLGGIFAAAGMISSYFASNITHLYICYGILVGTGAGLSFPPGVFIVTSYFVRLRGLANGIAISGSALGSIILPPFLRLLLEVYGFRGAVLIMGGLILNVLVGASLYDPVQQHLKKVPVDSNNKKNSVTYSRQYSVKSNSKKTMDKVQGAEEKGLLDDVIYETKENGVGGKEVNLLYKSDSCNDKLIRNISGANQPLITVQNNSNNQINRNVSNLSIGRPILSSESIGTRKVSTGSYMGRSNLAVGSTGQICRKTSTVSRQMPRVSSAVYMSRKVSVTSNMSSSSFRYISTPFHGSTLVGLNPEFSSQITMKKPHKPFSFWRLLEYIKCRKHKESKSLEDKAEPGVYATLLKDPLFIIILISNATTAIGYTNFTILLPAYAISLGFDKSLASYLLSIVATLDLVGRVGGSALSDWLPIDKKYYFIGGLLMSGVSLSLLPFVSSYSLVSVFCAAFGLSSGTYVGVTAIIMADLLGEERLASSYGISLFINGIIQLIGPPICGVAYEYLQSYRYIFHALGVSLIFGAAVWVYLPCKRKKEKQIILA